MVDQSHILIICHTNSAYQCLHKQRLLFSQETKIHVITACKYKTGKQCNVQNETKIAKQERLTKFQ